jgi:hypothetical protein
MPAEKSGQLVLEAWDVDGNRVVGKCKEEDRGARNCAVKATRREGWENGKEGFSDGGGAWKGGRAVMRGNHRPPSRGTKRYASPT